MNDEEQFIKACENNNMNAVIILVNKLVSILYNTHRGFVVACYNGHLEVVRFLTLLYQHTNMYGDNYELICDNTMTDGFTMACQKGHIKIVKYLTTLYQHTPYCKINIHNGDEHAFKQACSNGHLEIVQYLTTLYQHTAYNIINIHIHDEWAFTWALRFNKMNVILYLIKLYQKTKKHVCSKKRKRTSSDSEYKISSQVDIQYTYSPINVYSPSLDYIISIYNHPKYIANIGNYVEYDKFLI